MRVEVYLRHISQEVIGNRLIDATVVRVQDASCVDGYTKNCGCNMVAMPWLEKVSLPLRRAFLREESFGGLMYDTTTGMIFRLDKDAFAVVTRLRKEDDIEDLQRASVADTASALAQRYKLKQQEMREFLDELRILGLW